MAEAVQATENPLHRNNWTKVKNDLKEKGYAVVQGVLTEAECGDYIGLYREWLSQFGKNEAPFRLHSLIQRYRIGHFEPNWRVRLKAKPVFAKLWNTEKLLSSFDDVAIGEPPETAHLSDGFADADDGWLHIDQAKYRQGLHAYQGGVYLEETTETDWVFRILAGSHKHHQLFYESHPDAADRGRDDFCKLKDHEIEWYKDQGCELINVPVPKGGMVLWDSRLVHDNRRPENGRPNADRWRFIVFVSMTPAIWANPADLSLRKTAYKRMYLTTHWSSQGGNFFPDMTSDFPWKRIKTIECLPDVAQTDEAKFLSGILEYDFEDGRPNGEELRPVWTFGEYADNVEEPQPVNTVGEYGPKPVVSTRPTKHRNRSKETKDSQIKYPYCTRREKCSDCEIKKFTR